jgi:hypothetical protein
MEEPIASGMDPGWWKRRQELGEEIESLIEGRLESEFPTVDLSSEGMLA